MTSVRRHLVAASVLGLIVAGPAAAQSFEMKEQAGLRWVCGGVGLDEREAFAKLEPQADLKLVFAAGKEGGYVSNVGVSINDVKITADGPICLIQAPAGRYRVEARYGEAKSSASTTLGKRAGGPATLVLRFPQAH